MSNPIEIIPSLLAANFANLGSALREAEAGGAVAVQIDVMDGHFVPNLTVGPPVIRDLREVSPDLILDIHLMIANPALYIEDYVQAGADILTVHVEACTHLHRVVHQIKELEVRAGVALNPATPLTVIDEILQDVDLVLIMTVNPGFGGQKFIHSMLPKISRLQEMLQQRSLEHVLIEVDGGVNEETAPLLGAAGAQWLVAGSAVYTAGQSVAGQLQRLRELAESERQR